MAIASLLITVIGLLLVLMIAGTILVNQKRHRISPKEQARLKEKWNKIMDEAGHNPKGAILEADKMLDHALKLKGFKGNLGEKLKQASTLFRDLNGVWAAHKWRNRIAHELEMRITANEAKTALSQFRQALRDLGAL